MKRGIFDSLQIEQDKDEEGGEEANKGRRVREKEKERERQREREREKEKEREMLT